MPNKVNPKASEDPKEENKPVLEGESQEYSEGVKARQEARLHAVGDASDPENVTKGHPVEQEQSAPGNVSDDDSATVEARRERLAKTVGDNSQNDGISFGSSAEPRDNFDKKK